MRTDNKKEEERKKMNELERDISDHFYAMGIWMDHLASKRIAERLESAENVLGELDKIQEEVGADPSKFDMEKNYKVVGCKQYTLKGEYIRTFESMADASETLTGSRKKMTGAISAVCNGRAKSSGGFFWKFSD